MASRVPFSEDDLSCPVCYDIFKDPVLLSCSHSFCKECLLEFWKERDRECPFCRTISSKDPTCNLVLKNLCESLKARNERVLASSEFCSLHNEKLKLFCLIDKQPVCLVCRDSRNHANHRFKPIDEAAQDIKAELQTTLGPLQNKLKALDEVKEKLHLTARHNKVQVQCADRQIREEFKRLRQFLQEEEDARLAALWTEDEQKSQMIEEKIEGLSREISTLYNTIRAIERGHTADDITFLQNCKATLESSRAQFTLPDVQLASGALIDMAKHMGNLAFRVWNKMKEILTYTPVILDPNTASPSLILSEDLTSVRITDERQRLPDNPQRFDEKPRLLGSEGFDSGMHTWEIEVADNSRWSLGVAVESINRKGDVNRGYWRIYLHCGGYWASTPLTQATPLPLRGTLRWVRVQLDLDSGKLAFFDAKSNQHLHTFTHKFTERVFPYIANYCEISPIRILPGKVVVQTTC